MEVVIIGTIYCSVLTVEAVITGTTFSHVSNVEVDITGTVYVSVPTEIQFSCILAYFMQIRTAESHAI